MNNPPAFPRPYSEDAFLEETDYLAQDGMTLRDYFAAKAMLRTSVNTSYEDLAKTAYKIADEMMKARET